MIYAQLKTMDFALNLRASMNGTGIEQQGFPFLYNEGNIRSVSKPAALPCPVICRGDTVRPPPKIAGERMAVPRYMT